MATESKTILQLREDVTGCFSEIRKALEIREKLLIRQIDVIASQAQKSQPLIADIKFIPEDEIDLLECVRSFGKFNLDNLNFSNDLYTNEDYICASFDHETFYKCLEGNDEVDNGIPSKGGNEDFLNDNKTHENDIPFDLSNNTSLIKENVHNINESIVSITLNESKELIEKTFSNNFHIFLRHNDKLNETVASNPDRFQTQASQTQLKFSAKTKKPNITINNCNGTINLKNISNLTINCTNEKAVKGLKSSIYVEPSLSSTPITPISTTDEEESSSLQTPKNHESLLANDDESNSTNCEFYNRLITEIKNSVKQSSNNASQTISSVGSRGGMMRRSLSDGLQKSSTTDDSNSNDSFNRILLQNFENLKIVLENNENDTHPLIEQWLTEIISNTEIEPMQNNEILEHSEIHS